MKWQSNNITTNPDSDILDIGASETWIEAVMNDAREKSQRLLVHRTIAEKSLLLLRNAWFFHCLTPNPSPEKINELNEEVIAIKTLFDNVKKLGVDVSDLEAELSIVEKESLMIYCENEIASIIPWKGGNIWITKYNIKQALAKLRLLDVDVSRLETEFFTVEKKYVLCSCESLVNEYEKSVNEHSETRLVSLIPEIDCLDNPTQITMLTRVIEMFVPELAHIDLTPSSFIQAKEIGVDVSDLEKRLHIARNAYKVAYMKCLHKVVEKTKKATKNNVPLFEKAIEPLSEIGIYFPDIETRLE